MSLTDITFTVPGIVYGDYLDPNLGTEMALELEPYYSGRQKAGSGWSHWYVGVPRESVLNLIEDMGNVAECRYGDRYSNAVSAAMRKVIARLQPLVAPPKVDP